MDGLSDVITGYQCCYCRKGIIENNVNPLFIILLTNGELKKNRNERSSQEFYSHYDCFKKKIDINLQGTMVADLD